MVKTNIKVYCSSEGAAPREVIKQLKEIGFEPALGRFDFTYHWEADPSIEEVMKLLDRVVEALKGKQVLFKTDTF